MDEAEEPEALLYQQLSLFPPDISLLCADQYRREYGADVGDREAPEESGRLLIQICIEAQSMAYMDETAVLNRRIVVSIMDGCFLSR